MMMTMTIVTVQKQMQVGSSGAAADAAADAAAVQSFQQLHRIEKTTMKKRIAFVHSQL
jgi:hypothetical protein